MGLLSDRIRPHLQRFFTHHVFKYTTLYATILCLAAIIYTSLWPILLERKTYFSENALSPGGNSVVYDFNDATFASETSKKYCDAETSRDLFVQQQLESFGYHVTMIGKNSSSTVIGILAAPKGNGKESIAITVPLNAQCDNMGLALSVCQVLTRVPWLNHDIIFVAVPNAAQRISLDQVKRYATGQIREAFHLNFHTFATDRDNFRMSVLTEGFNGELPNLDMVNTVVYLAEENGIATSLHTQHTRNWHYYAKHLQPHETRKSLLFKYAHLLRTMANLIVSIPTGLHGYFRNQHTIHALTLGNTDEQRFGSKEEHNRVRNTWMVGRTLEGSVRCMNNLIEQLHQSFFLYFMMSEHEFVGFEEFIITMWVYVAPFILILFGFYSNGKTTLGDVLEAGKLFSMHLCAGLVALLAPTVLNLLPLPNLFFFYLAVLGAMVILIRAIHSGNKHEERVGSALITVGSLYTTLGLGSLTVFQSSLVPVLSIWLFIMFLVSRWHRMLAFVVFVLPFALLVLVAGSNKLNTIFWTQCLLDRGNVLFFTLCMLGVPTYLNFSHA